MGVSVLGALLLSAMTPTVETSDDSRLYGRVTTVEGRVVEGYLRWDHNEASPWDFLDGAKEIPLEVVHEAERLDPDFAGEMRRRRSIVAFGVRIRWDVDDISGPPRSDASIRFGQLASLEPVDARRVRLTLKDGEEVELLATSTDVGAGMRSLVVERPGAEPLELRWRELARVDFMEPPADASPPPSRRVHGTVRTWSGHELTGWIAWDRDEVLGSDELDGREGSTMHRIPFDSIESIEPLDRRSARVILRSGVERILRGTNDVEGSIRGIEVSLPGLGRAIVDWEELRGVRFHAPSEESGPAAAGGDAPAGVAGTEGRDGAPPGDARPAWGGALRGTVFALDGRVLEGEIRWGHDEERRWEVLDGWSGETDFDIELGVVRSIVRDGPEGVAVTLEDGRTLSLEGTDDVGEGHRGVFVKPDGRPRRLVRWRDVDRVVFDR